jgi:small conductance mechanosensitive channel
MTTNSTVVAHVKQPPVLDPVSTATATTHIWWNNIVKALPSFLAAIVFLFVAYWVARGAAALVRHFAQKRDRHDLGTIFASITFGVFMLLALMIAAAIVFPSVKPGSILSALGVGSVAVGFAFKDILQNLFAGVLLLLNRPFRRGDQIKVKDYEGTVEHIESRATLIKTYDGRRIIIPNADIYTSAVTVNTAFPIRRDQLDLHIGYNDDLLAAADFVIAAIKDIEGVESEPKPDVVPIEFGDGDVLVRARWWTKSLRSDVVHTRARVVDAVLQAFRKNGVDLPFPSQVIMLHDLTGENEGDRSEQRLRGFDHDDVPKPAPRPRRARARAKG